MCASWSTTPFDQMYNIPATWPYGWLNCTRAGPELLLRMHTSHQHSLCSLRESTAFAPQSEQTVCIERCRKGTQGHHLDRVKGR